MPHPNTYRKARRDNGDIQCTQYLNEAQHKIAHVYAITHNIRVQDLLAHFLDAFSGVNLHSPDTK